jgi:hypothetical protein
VVLYNHPRKERSAGGKVHPLSGNRSAAAVQFGKDFPRHVFGGGAFSWQRASVSSHAAKLTGIGSTPTAQAFDQMDIATQNQVVVSPSEWSIGTHSTGVMC